MKIALADQKIQVVFPLSERRALKRPIHAPIWDAGWLGILQILDGLGEKGLD